jgi:hypothetical protein
MKQPIAAFGNQIELSDFPLVKKQEKEENKRKKGAEEEKASDR